MTVTTNKSKYADAAGGRSVLKHGVRVYSGAAGSPPGPPSGRKGDSKGREKIETESERTQEKGTRSAFLPFVLSWSPDSRHLLCCSEGSCIVLRWDVAEILSRQFGGFVLGTENSSAGGAGTAGESGVAVDKGEVLTSHTSVSTPTPTPSHSPVSTPVSDPHRTSLSTYDAISSPVESVSVPVSPSEGMSAGAPTWPPRQMYDHHSIQISAAEVTSVAWLPMPLPQAPIASPISPNGKLSTENILSGGGGSTGSDIEEPLTLHSVCGSEAPMSQLPSLARASEIVYVSGVPERFCDAMESSEGPKKLSRGKPKGLCRGESKDVERKSKAGLRDRKSARVIGGDYIDVDNDAGGRSSTGSGDGAGAGGDDDGGGGGGGSGGGGGGSSRSRSSSSSSSSTSAACKPEPRSHDTLGTPPLAFISCSSNGRLVMSSIHGVVLASTYFVDTGKDPSFATEVFSSLSTLY